jgi:hypothetical protein
VRRYRDLVASIPAADPGDDFGRRRGVVGHGLRLGLLVGFAVTVVAVAIGFSIVAIPLFLLAQVLEPGSRIDHPFLREGLLVWALPIGIVIGVVCGTAVGVWVARGGRFPTDDRDRRYSS